MRGSISKRIIRGALAVLLLASFVINISAYFLIRNQLLNEKNHYARSITALLADMITYEAEEERKEVTPKSYDTVQTCCDYICGYYNCDYAYAFVPNLNNDTITYIYIGSPNELDKQKYPNHGIGVTKEYKLNKEELKLYSAEVPIEANFTLVEDNNENGHEYRTETVRMDGYGNKFFVAVEYSYDSIFRPINLIFFIFSLTVAIIIVSAYIIIVIYLKKKVIKPIDTICNTMLSYSSDSGEMQKLDFKGNNEFALISSSYNQMCDHISEYIDKIKAFTDEKTVRQTELNVAARIQKGFLPKHEFVDKDFIIAAMMKPAREVGGDFYDYFAIDENRTFMIVADVSDKGISAAMYMTKAIAIIKQYAKLGLPLNEVLEQSNNALCQNNSEFLFATAFAAIFDKTDNTLYYSNAGHNYPYVVGKGILRLDDAKGSLLGTFENEKYSVTKFKLNDGDMLFLYTDGVTEASNSNKEFYGETRLEKALKEFASSNKRNLIDAVKDDISNFVNGADQYDDMTMLTFTFVKTTLMVLDANINEFNKIKEKVLSLGLDKSIALKVCLVIEEYFANICAFGYPDGVTNDDKIILEISTSNKVEIRIIDTGVSVKRAENLDSGNLDFDKLSPELGQFIASSHTNFVKYKQEDGKNILTITII